jgi:thiosulfate sulfurtransferase
MSKSTSMSGDSTRGPPRGAAPRRALCSRAVDAIPEIDVDEARRLHAAGGATFVDVRDPGSHRAAHVPGAVRVDDASLQRFLDATPRERPLVVYCYHGHTSLGGAAFFLDQGFTQVWSMTGGFEAWRGRHPHESA